MLSLSDSSRLVMRLPAASIPQAIPLAGKRLDIGGRTVPCGSARDSSPSGPLAHLFSRFVTIKGFADCARTSLREACNRQLEAHERAGVTEYE